MALTVDYSQPLMSAQLSTSASWLLPYYRRWSSAGDWGGYANGSLLIHRGAVVSASSYVRRYYVCNHMDGFYGSVTNGYRLARCRDSTVVEGSPHSLFNVSNFSLSIS